MKNNVKDVPYMKRERPDGNGLRLCRKMHTWHIWIKHPGQMS